jgi:hypothetical protein
MNGVCNHWTMLQKEEELQRKTLWLPRTYWKVQVCSLNSIVTMNLPHGVFWQYAGDGSGHFDLALAWHKDLVVFAVDGIVGSKQSELGPVVRRENENSSS